MILVDGADKVFFYQHVPGLVEPFWDHFGIPPKKNLEKLCPKPSAHRNSVAKHQQVHRYFIRTGLFLGMYFLFTTNKASPEAFSIWTPRCVSVSLNLLEKHPCRLPKYRVFKRWNPKPSKYDPKWRFGGDRSSNFEIRPLLLQAFGL